MVVPFGAFPFMMKRRRPKGGVRRPKEILISINNPIHTGSQPRAEEMGIKIGTAIMIMAI